MRIDSAVLYEAVGEARRRTPFLDELLHRRPDAVIVGGFLRDTIAGIPPKDIDVILTDPVHYGPAMTPRPDDFTSMGGFRVDSMEGGMSVDYWHAMAAVHTDGLSPLSLTRHFPLECQKIAYHPATDRAEAMNFAQIQERRLRVATPAPTRGVLAKVSRMITQGWKVVGIPPMIYMMEDQLLDCFRLVQRPLSVQDVVQLFSINKSFTPPTERSVRACVWYTMTQGHLAEVTDPATLPRDRKYALQTRPADWATRDNALIF